MLTVTPPTQMNDRLKSYSTFSYTHKVSNDGINFNFVFPYICSFLHYLYLEMLVNVKLDVSWLQTLLVFLFLNGMAKMKLAILPFLCCGEIMKNSIGQEPRQLTLVH